MPTFTIDNKKITVDKGTSILKAGLDNGIKIPHFCYHEKLSIDGCCRMCLVEVEKMPKLTIACNTPVADDMVVHTHSPKVMKARAGVMEFLLINHPLDCPICDQAGECRLQEYCFEYGIPHSRFREEKRKRRKRFSIGEHIVFDEERCILCRRCVRFCREITKTGEIAVFNRGDRSWIDIYSGKGLNNKYSLCTTDICPIGALTSKDFRFKVRVWFLKEVESICPECSNGCNIKICVRDNKIYRYLPRQNDKVNDTWICDEGRLSYKKILSDDRITQPLIRSGDKQIPVKWDEALAVIAKGFKGKDGNIDGSKVGGIGSPHSTNEECFLFQRFMREVIGTNNIDFTVIKGDKDNILIKEEKAPNARGARDMRLFPCNGGRGISDMIKGIATGDIKILYIMGRDLMGLEEKGRILDSFGKLDLLVVQDTHVSDLSRKGDIVLPSATFAEKDGTFTNINGIVQCITKGVEPPGDSLPDWEIISRLSKAMGYTMEYNSPEEIMAEISKEIPGYKL
ncbi:MAG: molybdopterin-dependent oxidoreductase [Nitrospinae bacterium]|nr:molybdopterin-dependent oxidoreductase [Nitrospinota bacterium]